MLAYFFTTEDMYITVICMAKDISFNLEKMAYLIKISKKGLFELIKGHGEKEVCLCT
jgi:hypothetical protein